MMNRRQFLKGLLGGAAVLSTVQADTLQQMLKKPDSGSYFVGPPKFVGKMPVRTELAVLSADAPAARAIGWKIEEVVGIGLYNTSTPEERRERAERHQAWLDSLPDDYDHEADIVLCRDSGIQAIHETRGTMYSSLEIANSPPDDAIAIYQGAEAVETLTDLPSSDPEQTTRYVRATQANYVRVEGLGWVQLA